MRERARVSRSSICRRVEIITRIILHPVVLQLVDVVGNTHLVPIGMGIGKINRLWIVVCHQHVKPFAGSVVLIHTDSIATGLSAPSSS